MDDSERARRRNEIGEQVRRRQEEMGHEGPLPAFLNILTDFMIDTDERLRALEHRAANDDDALNRLADLEARTRPLG